MVPLVAYPGKIGAETRDCFVGGQPVPCPQAARENQILAGTEKLDVLPQIPALNRRNDALFTTLLLLTLLTFAALAIFKISIFGKTLGEYVRPIWYFILLAIATVVWQYLVGLNLDDNGLGIRISQWFWEALVLLSAYRLSKQPNVSYGNFFFLGVFYSFIIHGLKVSIRYYFYDKSLLYCLDRFYTAASSSWPWRSS